MTTVFVAGGAGGVGAGVVTKWLETRAKVVTATRSSERGRRLREAAADLPGELVVLDGSSSDPVLLEAMLDEHGPIDHAVASVGGGGWELAPLDRIGAAMFRRVVEDGITAHWEVARKLIGALKPGGSYVFINGGAALEVVPGAGPLSLVARSQLALADIFRAEAGDGGPRIVSMVLNTPISTPARGAGKPGWLSPEDVGTACVRFAHGSSDEPTIVLGTPKEAANV